MVNGWKITAIVFIILFILQTLLFGLLIMWGIDSIEKEETCIYNVCDGYDSYAFDDYSNLCYCYENHEVVKQEYIR